MNKYKKSIFIFWVIAFAIVGCEQGPSSNISNSFIEKIAVIEKPLPSKYVGYNLYVKTDKASTFVTNVNFLNIIYTDHYQNSFKDFYSFLYALLKQNFQINADIAVKYEYQTFIENPKIMELSTESIIGKYFEQDISKKKYYFYPKALSISDAQTILYKMFLEGYLISFDDYGGKYNIVKYKN
jgi:hypothetical protein